MQILIVEDEKRLAEALKQILLEQKYMADVVYDGNDGLDYGMSGIYDLIILDIMLPHDKALCARGAARARQGAHATQRRGHAR